MGDIQYILINLPIAISVIIVLLILIYNRTKKIFEPYPAQHFGEIVLDGLAGGFVGSVLGAMLFYLLVVALHFLRLSIVMTSNFSIIPSALRGMVFGASIGGFVAYFFRKSFKAWPVRFVVALGGGIASVLVTLFLAIKTF